MRDKMKKVSIIIPVYNSAKYLDKCIRSLINQTLDDIEIIFVNDGSTDNSKDIIDKYLKKDKRIKLLNKANGGQASARNLGLTKASGEYIAFLDSDDYVDKSMYKTLYDRAKQDDLDIVICNYYYDYGNKIIKANNNITKEKEKVIKEEEYITMTPSAWNKIIKKDYLKKCHFSFPEGIIYEDFAAIPLLSLNNPKIVYLNKCLYYYVQSSSSTMRNDTYKEKYNDIFKATKYLYDNMINKGKNRELEYLITYHFLYLGSLNFYKYKKFDNINHIAKEMHNYFPKWYKNELVLSKFTKKEVTYMKLFYYKKYFLINIYRRLLHKNEAQ